MSRQQRRKERRRRAANQQTASQRSTSRNEPIIVDQRPWYFRYGYHVGVWSGAALGVAWYAIFRDFIGLIVGIIGGQIAGVLLSRQGTRN